MSTLAILFSIFCILFFLVLIVTIIRNTYWNPTPYDFGHDETTTTTTTTTVVDTPAADSGPTYDVVGTIVMQQEGSQFYVIDPADSEKIWVNASDDMYRDADGKVWRLK